MHPGNVKRKELLGLIGTKVRYNRRLWTDSKILAGQRNVKSRRTGAAKSGARTSLTQ